MKISNPLDVLLGAPVRVAILRTLVGTRTELTGGEAARLAGVSWPQAIEALKKFVEAGIVTRRRAGGGGLYRLNRDAEIVRKGLVPLFSTENDLMNNALKKFTDAISGLRPVSVVLFGSSARGDRRVTSDIDLLVVLPAKTAAAGEKIAGKAAEIGSVAGFRLAPLIMTTAEIKKASGSKKQLIDNIREDGRMIFGKEMDES